VRNIAVFRSASLKQHIKEYSCREQAITEVDFKEVLLTVVNRVYLVQESDNAWINRKEPSCCTKYSHFFDLLRDH
jgi:hypothetical protein